MGGGRVLGLGGRPSHQRHVRACMPPATLSTRVCPGHGGRSTSPRWTCARRYDTSLPGNLRVGTVQFRTVRVQPSTCDNAEELFGEPQCYRAFDSADEDRQPYGIGGRYTWSCCNSTLYRSLTFTPSLLNIEMTFGQGGYTVELPYSNKTAAQELVASMKVRRDTW